MKKILKAITKDKMKRKHNKDNFFVKDVISLNDNSKQKYFDELSYQKYLITLKNERRDLYEE